MYRTSFVARKHGCLHEIEDKISLDKIYYCFDYLRGLIKKDLEIGKKEN